MVDYNSNPNCKIFTELPKDQIKFWFDFKQKKFLHNVDTFYYSVKFKEDFTTDSSDHAVIRFRKLVLKYKEELSRSYDGCIPFYLQGLNSLNIIPLSFAHMYSFWLPVNVSFRFVPACSGNTVLLELSKNLSNM